MWAVSGGNFLSEIGGTATCHLSNKGHALHVKVARWGYESLARSGR